LAIRDSRRCSESAISAHRLQGAGNVGVELNPQLHRRPLDSHPAIRSGSIGEIEQLLSQTYGARRFLPGSRVRSLNVHANHWQSEAMALSFCAYGAAVEVQFPEADFWRQ
jgi:hypothetical protein